MAAPEGNQFWKLRATHGRGKIFESPELLWDAACQYFESTDSRKWVKKDWVGKDAVQVERENETPYTKTGLCLFLDISEWRLLVDLKSVSEDFSQVVSRIENIIITQKTEGASVGAFNASIVSLELGLRQQIDHTTNGENLPSANPIITVEIVKPKEEE
jgi:hypothetical protein